MQFVKSELKKVVKLLNSNHHRKKSKTIYFITENFPIHGERKYIATNLTFVEENIMGQSFLESEFKEKDDMLAKDDSFVMKMFCEISLIDIEMNGKYIGLIFEDGFIKITY